MIIHYCWFGRGEMPDKEKCCIASWKRIFPDAEYKLWNEDNFDVDQCKFSAQAYEARKFAFVSDYVRVKVLEEYGGLYLDSDFEVLKDFSCYMEKYENFIGFETRAHLGTAIMYMQPHHELMKRFVDYYEHKEFRLKSGEIDNVANVVILSDLLKKQGFTPNGMQQQIADIHIFNREVFYPKKLSETEFRITDETFGVHLCSNSWMSEKEKRRGQNKFWINVCRPILRFLRNAIIGILGEDKARIIEIKLRDKMK